MQIFFLIMLTAAGFFIAMIQTKVIIKYLNLLISPKGLNINCRWIMYVLTPLSIMICCCISIEAGLMAFVVHFFSIFLMMPIIILWMMYSSASRMDASKKQMGIQQKAMTIPEKISLYGPHIFEILIRIYAIGLILFYLFNINAKIANYKSAYNFLMADFKFQIISVIIPFVMTIILRVSKTAYKERRFDSIYKKIRAKALSPSVQEKCNIIYAYIVGIVLTFLAYIILPIKSYVFDYIGNAAHTGFTFGGLNICFIATFVLNTVLFFVYPIRMIKKCYRQFSNMIWTCFLGLFLTVGMSAILAPIGEIIDISNNTSVVTFLGFNIVLLFMEFLDIKQEKAAPPIESRTIKN